MEKDKEKWIDEMMGELDNWNAKKMNPTTVQFLKKEMAKSEKSQKFSIRSLWQVAAIMLLLIISNAYIVMNNIEDTSITVAFQENPYEAYLQSYNILPLDLQTSSYE